MVADSKIAIIGGGLVGSLLSLYLRRRGYEVIVFERRPDMRKNNLYAGRSINLAVSTRGLIPLDELGIGAAIRPIAIPMHGRMVHNVDGKVNFQPYGRTGQFINSVSRSDLNIMLIDEAEKSGVKYRFEHRCLGVNSEETEITFKTRSSETIEREKFDVIIGADGAYSAVRSAMQVTDRFNYSQQYIEHGYKELHIPAGHEGEFRIHRNALHIWPRESFMMIALPNPDGSFTCTLFFPFEGNPSFKTLSSDEAVLNFFKATFPDAMDLMPGLLNDFNQNPVSSLVTIKCFPWTQRRTLLLGDAAHAIVPFYGQGMNAGFEDCRILNQLLNKYSDNWEMVLPIFQAIRKPDADAVAQLALNNFIEMRDHVADEKFVLRKKIEAKLHELYPTRWIPLYSMVTFHPEIRYSNAYATGQKQDEIMNRVLSKPDIETTWTDLNFESIVNELENS